MAVYIASSIPLPSIPWVEDAPAFYTEEITGDSRHESVRRQFTLPYLYYAGSYMGCGCGFVKGATEQEEIDQIQRDYLMLADYVESARAEGAAIQFFSCLDGDQLAEPELREVVSEDTLRDESFEFEEKAFYTIEGRSDRAT